MQSDKSKRAITGMLDICDKIIGKFYIAASMGVVSNKMSCIEFAYKFLYETTRNYNLISQDMGIVLGPVNMTVRQFNTDIECVERTFGVMFHALQKMRGILTVWQDELDQE